MSLRSVGTPKAAVPSVGTTAADGPAGSGTAASKRISRPGNPAASASRARSSPWRDWIQSAKTREGTATVRTGPFVEAASWSWRVGPNQVFSSFASSFASICLRMEVQISVIVRDRFSTRFPQLWKPVGTRGPGVYA